MNFKIELTNLRTLLGSLSTTEAATLASQLPFGHLLPVDYRLGLNYPMIVARKERQIVGAVVFEVSSELVRTRERVRWLSTVATARRQGVATAMLQKLFQEISTTNLALEFSLYTDAGAQLKPLIYELGQVYGVEVDDEDLQWQRQQEQQLGRPLLPGEQDFPRL